MRAYHAQDNATIQTLTVPNVSECKEHLELTYTQTYNSNGYELHIKNRTVVDQNTDYKLDISI